MSHLLWQMIRVPVVDKLFGTGIKPEMFVIHTLICCLLERRFLDNCVLSQIQRTRFLMHSEFR